MNLPNMNRPTPLLFLLPLLTCALLEARLTLPEVFSTDMILQRDVLLPVWGEATDGAVVTVSFNGVKREATATGGEWKVIFPPMPVNASPREMTITSSSDDEVIRFGNILIGDVWLASGQSNMEMHLAGVKGGKEAIAKSANPLLRFFTVNRALEEKDPPLGDKWVISGPATSGSMTAVGYHFAKEIVESQNIPIGLIHCSYGGTLTETWCSPAVLRQGYPVWNAFEKKVLENPHWNKRNTSSFLYTRMLKTVMPYSVKGFIWYQGESNASRAEEQKTLFPAMVRDWRKRWGDPDLPFYIVQLARYEAANWHAFRCAQLDVWKNTANSFMAVTIDLSKDWNENDHPVHPTTKAPIGHRLALAARATVYGEADLVYSGPVIHSMSVEKHKAVLCFDHVGTGLVASDAKALRGFYLSADGETFVPGTASIEGGRVFVSSPAVPNPVAVRYGAETDMGKVALDVNLGNKEGLPASPFTVER